MQVTRMMVTCYQITAQIILVTGVAGGGGGKRVGAGVIVGERQGIVGEEVKAAAGQ